MNFPKSIRGLDDVIGLYNVFILDQWGVMHDGAKGYAEAIECVKELYKKKNDIIIVSNSSKRRDLTIRNLSTLGFDPKYFFQVMTSGEMIWQSLKNKKYDFIKKLKKNCYHLFNSKEKDAKLFIGGLKNFNFVKDIKDADFILACNTSYGLNTIDYIPILNKALEKNLPFICANPDYETIENISGNLVICMGTVAELYKQLGGETFILGKPTIDIYAESTKNIKNIDKSKILAIGDSIHHDIKGANMFGVDSLLVTSGIHKSNFDNYRPKWDSADNKLKNLNIKPTYLCSKFHL